VIGVLSSEILSDFENRFVSFYIFKDASDYQWKVISIEIDQIESVPSLRLTIEKEKAKLHEVFRRICHK
jgi:hypothetical protein